MARVCGGAPVVAADECGLSCVVRVRKSVTETFYSEAAGLNTRL